MIMKIRYIFIFLASMSFLFSSCDDFLGIKPKGILIPETCEHYESLLNYAHLMKSSESYPLYMTDDVFLPYDDVQTGGFVGLDLPNQNLYSFASEVYGDGEDDYLWNDSYYRIYTYNVIINNVMSSSGSSDDVKSRVKAEALVGRAFEYLNLVNAYAKHYDKETAGTDPGVPLILDEDINKSNLERATVQAVYDQIQEDLELAVRDLPEAPVLNAYRASSSVGYGLSARMYLYMGNYEEALKNANLSLQQNDYLLDLKEYKVVDETKYFGRLDYPNEPANNRENIYIRKPPYVYGVNASVYASEELVELYDKYGAKDKDQRFALFFTRKLGTNSYDYDLYAPYVSFNIAMSTPEMYLIAAECEARIGGKEGVTKAMGYVNKLRDMRVKDNKELSATTNEEALDIVLEERRRELVMNGCTRLIDLKRLNREERYAKAIVHDVNGVKHTLEPNDPKYILPIPPNVIRFNPNMEKNER